MNKMQRKWNTRLFLQAAAALTFALLLACLSICPSHAAEGYDKTAPASETSSSKSIGKYGMTPVYGFDVKDGVYQIKVDSSSTFFHIDEAELTVKDGEMTARMTLSSTSYEFIYLGTAEEAAAAPLSDYLKPKDVDYRSTFPFPVEALDKPIDCAAFSKKKDQWYNRKILFDATSLPSSALLITLPDYDRIEDALKAYDEENGTSTLEDAQPAEEADPGSVPANPVDIDLKDGEYSIQVNMTGGSGRASVTSPTWLIVKEGKAYARLLWSSTYYDYMIVGGKKYMNETTDGGNSSFTIPIVRMDEPIPVIADTTAMGDPVEIAYALTFYQNTVADKNKVPQEAAVHVLIIALVIIIAGGILNLLIKRRKKQ